MGRGVECLYAITAKYSAKPTHAHNPRRGADTREIRKRTGLPNSKVRYRRDKLAGEGLIDVRDADGYHPGDPPKVFELSDRGRQAIKMGLLEETTLPDPTDIESVAERCQELSARLNAIRADLQEHEPHADTRLDQVETTITENKERLEELEGGADREPPRRYAWKT